jgi:hypothetical protein
MSETLETEMWMTQSDSNRSLSTCQPVDTHTAVDGLVVGSWRVQDEGDDRSAAYRFHNGLTYDVDDEARRSNDWRVVYRMRSHPGAHPLRHKALRVVDDHAVLLRY